jgi:hypothetical protein
MAFSGSVTDTILNVFEGLLRGFVEDQVSETVCEELGAIGTTLVQDMIALAAEWLDPYLLPLEPWQKNATAAELNMTVPPQVKLMNFQEEGDDQYWFYDALKEVDAALGVWLIDPNTTRARWQRLGCKHLLARTSVR